ncbi:MAG: hypothetical protein VB876_04995 [Pirellulales bacterium]
MRNSILRTYRLGVISNQLVVLALVAATAAIASGCAGVVSVIATNMIDVSPEHLKRLRRLPTTSAG